MKGIDTAPEACPECGEDSFLPFYVMEADKKSKLSCSNYQCGYEFRTEQAVRELHRSEQNCHEYDCGGDLELVGEELYRCSECGRYNGIATPSSGTLYSTSVCPLCMTTSPRNIDFHHWDYERDIGVHLCRECHNSLHDGKRAHEQTREHPDGESWRVQASSNLVNMHKDIHGRPESWDCFFERYNLPEDHPDYADIRTMEL